MNSPIKFICPNCGNPVVGLATETQMMVHFTESACTSCGHLLTEANIIKQVQDYAMRHFNQIFSSDE